MNSLRTLTRGLSVIRALNATNGANIQVIARETGVSRGSVHRILETLAAEGYVRHVKGRYYVERKLCLMTAAIIESAWIDRAQPAIEELCRDVRWPITVMRPNGLAMETCAGTDKLSPFRHRTVRLGVRLPMMGSAAGRVFVAAQPDAMRAQLVESLSRAAEFPEDQEFCRNQRQALEILAGVRQKGVATAGVGRITVIAVPIVQDDGLVLGAMSLRHFTASISTAEVIRTNIAKMQSTAKGIANP